MGAIVGDGYVEIRPGVSYTLTISATDKEFIDEFRRAFKKWQGIDLKIRRVRNHNIHHRDTWVVCHHNKELCLFFKNYDINNLYSVDRETKAAFLRGLYDSEGSVSKSRRNRAVYLYNTNTKIIDLVRTILRDEFRISSSIYIDRRKARKDTYAIIIYGRHNLMRFHENIGFSINRKQRGLEYLLGGYKRYHWSEEEINFLKENYMSLSGDEINKQLGTSSHKYRVQDKVKHLGLKKLRRWTDEEKQFLKANYGKIKVSIIAKRMGRSELSVRDMARKLGLKSELNKKWSKELIIHKLLKYPPEISYNSLYREDRALLQACIAYFGSFNNAKKSAGMPIVLIGNQYKKIILPPR